MKKRILTLSLVLALASIAVLGGTLAYLTDKQDVKNVFTVGDVDIKLDETVVDEYGNAKTDDEGNKIRTEEGNAYRILPGHEYVKDPTVTVLKDSEDSYVRMLVTVNKLSTLDEIFQPTGADLKVIFEGHDNTEWELVKEEGTREGDTITYEFRYKDTVKRNQKADQVLDALFDKIVIPEKITDEQLEKLQGFDIEIVAQAIQADGFDSVDAAWEAFE